MTAEVGTVKITFKNTVNGSPIVMDGRFYTNPFGENYAITKFKYYISNVRINNIDKAADGQVYRPEQRSKWEKSIYDLFDDFYPSALEVKNLVTVQFIPVFKNGTAMPGRVVTKIIVKEGKRKYL